MSQSTDVARKILLVEDEASLREALRYNLGKAGYEVLATGDGWEALEMARREKPDVMILDIMLPGLDGLEVCRQLRRETATPILLLTARGTEADKVVGLESGADDYMTKPFSLRELQARIRALLRRVDMAGAPQPGAALLRSGDLEVDEARHEATLRGVPLPLKPKEFALLAYLMRNKGRALSREHLLERVWGYDYEGDARTVDVHVRWLREKVEPDPGQPRRIVTVRSVGYRFEE
ncbi:MAG: response regulator transcription factor [Chloroflexi bacterium]|nr:response regulator transcription factor [Chloroflexota bacterium]